MTYFAFLGWFIGIPLIFLLIVSWWDGRNGRTLPHSLGSWPPAFVIGAHVVVALLYTTPWDNYLVATGVWWYNPALVTGLVLGWVPIEEYTFFVVQTIFTSLWLLFLARRWAAQAPAVMPDNGYAMRIGGTALVGAIWLGSVILLASGWQPGTYLGLELVWALPPVIIQMAFGADILWSYRRIVAWGIGLPTLYLSLTDIVALTSGTWVIDPAQSTGLFIGSLPIEELVFFFLTNTLVVLGTVLVLARASQARAPHGLRMWMQRIAFRNVSSQSELI